MTTGLQVINIRKSFDRRVALQDVTFNLEAGQLYGLLGGSGAGKTTLIRLLIGSLVADKGELQVLGYNPATQFRQLRAQLGFMPQEDALYLDLTALENVLFFWRGRNHRATNQAAVEVLTQCGLGDRLHDLVGNFSGGMRRRVSLACALVGDPQLLILDEPTAALDPLLRHEIWQILIRRGRAGATILVSTHQVEEAQYCKELLLLQEGSLIAQRSPADLMKGAQGGTLDAQVRNLLLAHRKEQA